MSRNLLLLRHSLSFHYNLGRSKYVLVFGSVIVAICMNGCSTAGSYGTVKDYVNGEHGAIKVSLPDNAPSIRRGFHPVPVDKDRRSPPTEHLGIDILGAAGTPVIAPAKGLVASSFFEPMYGNHVVIAHGEDEQGLQVHTRFLHLQKRWVKEGDAVERGQQIGTLGRTGFLAGGITHLHYELAREDPASGRIKAMDPNAYWVNGAGRVTCFDSSKQWLDEPFSTTYPVVCKGIDWE